MRDVGEINHVIFFIFLVPAVRMGLEAGERIEFLDDGLVMRCLDLSSESGCLSCCFLSVGSFLGRRELGRHARSRS